MRLDLQLIEIFPTLFLICLHL